MNGRSIFRKIIFLSAVAAFLVLSACSNDDSTNDTAPGVPSGGGYPPVITSFTPTSGPVGTPVTITGAELGSTATVRFNGVSASGVTATGTTSLTAAVPAGATTGPITVATAAGTATSSADFTVTTAAASVVRGVAVDPYIIGATFCEDKDRNSACDAGELISTPSDSKGVFTFQNTLTSGSDLLIKDKGKHNGVAYTGEIKRAVDQDTNLVVSPLTTLLAIGWTADNVISVLTHTAGITGLTAADLMKDPLDGIEALDQTTLTADHFKIVWANTAVHSFLSIMQGVLIGPGKGYHITYDMFTNPTVSIGGHSPQWYVDRMVERIGMGLDPAILADIDSQLASAKTACNAAGLAAPPRAAAGDVLRGSAAIADYVIKKVIADLTYAPTLAEYGPWRSELGRNFYIIRSKNDPCIKAGIQHGALPDVTACSSFSINSTTGLVECITN